MKATDLDYDVECPVCVDGEPERYDGCPACDGSGTINRYRDGRPGHVTLDLRLSPRGLVVREEMPVRDENTGGFEGRYGNWTPTDITTGAMAGYEQDTVDQLANRPIGSNDSLYGTKRRAESTDATVGDPPELEKEEVAPPISVDNFPSGSFPASPDLSEEEITAWQRARGSEHTARLFERIREERVAAGLREA